MKNLACILLIFFLTYSCTPIDEDVTPTYQDPGVNSFTVILLGNQNSMEPSFYSSSRNKRYMIAEAKANAQDIDFGYANGREEGNEYFVGSPDDESMAFVYDNLHTGMQTWEHLNSTRFRLTDLTVDQFDTLSRAYSLIKVYSEGYEPVVSSRVRGKEIKENAVIAFTTEEGKKGLFMVIERSGSYDTPGSITINVKVEKIER